MSRTRGLQIFVAALCMSAFAADWAIAQDAAAPSQSGATASPETQDGWLLRGRGGNRNPFRTMPTPGATGSFQNKQQPGVRLAPNPPMPSTAAGPADAAPGNGPSCLIGFWRRANQCVPVSIPENATLDLTGHNWTCERGFRRQGQGCTAVPVPENASLATDGRNWACNYGFRRNANSCVAIVVPEYASLDAAGHAWRCNQGYTQRGQVCVDDATARLQAEADKAVAARPGTAAARAPAASTGITVNSSENRNGRSSKAKVVIGRF
jgi:hypothetical protein